MNTLEVSKNDYIILKDIDNIILIKKKDIEEIVIDKNSINTYKFTIFSNKDNFNKIYICTAYDHRYNIESCKEFVKGIGTVLC